jgi:hypothetical protein
MMWMLSTVDGNRQKGKLLVIECKALKWAKANNAPPLKDHLDKSPWQMGWLWHHFHDYDDCKTKETWCIKCMNKGDKLYDVPTCYTKFLKYDLFYIKLKAFTTSSWRTTQSGWRSIVHLMLWIIVSQPRLVATLNWCGEKCVTKVSIIENIKHNLWIDIMFLPL